jgi:hypothetical protein
MAGLPIIKPELRTRRIQSFKVSVGMNRRNGFAHLGISHLVFEVGRARPSASTLLRARTADDEENIIPAWMSTQLNGESDFLYYSVTKALTLGRRPFEKGRICRTDTELY